MPGPGDPAPDFTLPDTHRVQQDEMTDFEIVSVVPILRMYDVAATTRFYVHYLGCRLEWQHGDGDRPVDMRVARDGLRLQLSSYPGDGTPGSVVLVVVRNLDVLHAELHEREYPFMNPGIEEGPGSGREMVLIDPASNQIRFYEPAAIS